MNISLKSKIRHWFNFYRMALKSTDPDIIANCKNSKDFYERWGNIEKISFDDWWKSHSHLFLQRQEIEILSGQFTTEDNSIYFKVPLTFAPIAVSKYFARIYREEQDKRITTKSKVKKKYQGSFELKPVEFQATNFRYYTVFAEKVYLPLYIKTSKQPVTGSIIELAIVKFKNLTIKTEEKSRSGKKQRIAPFRQDMNESYTTLSRTATRYRQIVENLIKNASLGEFPGDYQQKSTSNLTAKRKSSATNQDKKKVGRKRIARQIGYEKTKMIVDQDSPIGRKTYLNVVSRKVYKNKY